MPCAYLCMNAEKLASNISLDFCSRNFEGEYRMAKQCLDGRILEYVTSRHSDNVCINSTFINYCSPGTFQRQLERLQSRDDHVTNSFCHSLVCKTAHVIEVIF